MQSSGDFTVQGFPLYYPENYYFTIYKIDCIKLKEVLKVQELKHLGQNIWLEYDFYRINIDENSFGHFALDLDPLSKINNPESNYNIRNQHSCFLLYDNARFTNHPKGSGFEDFLIKYLEPNCNEITQPIIYKYQIKYNSAFRPTHQHRHEIKPLFSFLKEQQVIGCNLFDDIQGLKYDFNFFHQEY